MGTFARFVALLFLAFGLYCPAAKGPLGTALKGEAHPCSIHRKLRAFPLYQNKLGESCPAEARRVLLSRGTLHMRWFFDLERTTSPRACDPRGDRVAVPVSDGPSSIL